MASERMRSTVAAFTRGTVSMMMEERQMCSGDSLQGRSAGANSLCVCVVTPWFENQCENFNDRL